MARGRAGLLAGSMLICLLCADARVASRKRNAPPSSTASARVQKARDMLYDDRAPPRASSSAFCPALPAVLSFALTAVLRGVSAASALAILRPLEEAGELGGGETLAAIAAAYGVAGEHETSAAYYGRSAAMVKKRTGLAGAKVRQGRPGAPFPLVVTTKRFAKTAMHLRRLASRRTCWPT